MSEMGSVGKAQAPCGSCKYLRWHGKTVESEDAHALMQSYLFTIPLCVCVYFLWSCCWFTIQHKNCHL